MNKTDMEVKRIYRFSLPVRIAHWVNALSFIMLFVSALPMYTDFFNWLYPVFGGPAGARLVHRIFAVIFLMPTIFIIVTDPKSFVQWTGNILSWKQYDFKFFTEFPKEFFGRESHVPKQDFFNAGQKLNSLLTISGAALMVVSGFLMWFSGLFPKEAVQWAYPMHDVGVGVLVAVVLGHIYLSVGHPASRPSIKGMTEGWVDAEYAKAHHGRWYEQVMKENAASDKNE